MTLPEWTYPRLCAHRGAGRLAPENTLTAMRVGLAYGYTMVEFDVKLGVHFPMDTSTVSILGWEKGLPALERWNSRP